MKKAQDYEIGERVQEEGYDAGKVVAIVLHPSRKSIAYLLLVNSDNEYTIYRGMTDANCKLGLARNIPESVAMHFAEVIQGGEPPPPPPSSKNGKKFPVVSKKPVEPESVEEADEPTKVPSFDFV
jgi:hypothetical protein